jgi:Putative abortive phage resistance protein AbiGi, antitoxin
MPSSPGTVSKILWHFTGGPKWNEVEKRQEEKRKPIEDAYTALINIIQSHEIRVGQYREVLKANLAKVHRVEPITKEIIEEVNVYREVESSPVCCIADIPIMHLSYHSERYGKIAIGFHRSSTFNHGFSPVFYLLQNSALLQALYTGMHRIGATHGDVNLALGEPSIAETVPMTLGLAATEIRSFQEAFYELTKMTNGLLTRISDAIINMQTVLAFIKTFKESEFDTIYTEREWRSISPFKYEYADVSMVVLPRAGGYFERFVAESESIGVPKTVSIVAWEDLVEH